MRGSISLQSCMFRGFAQVYFAWIPNLVRHWASCVVNSYQGTNILSCTQSDNGWQLNSWIVRRYSQWASNLYISAPALDPGKPSGYSAGRRRLFLSLLFFSGTSISRLFSLRRAIMLRWGFRYVWTRTPFTRCSYPGVMEMHTNNAGRIPLQRSFTSEWWFVSLCSPRDGTSNRYYGDKGFYIRKKYGVLAGIMGIAGASLYLSAKEIRESRDAAESGSTYVYPANEGSVTVCSDSLVGSCITIKLAGLASRLQYTWHSPLEVYRELQVICAPWNCLDL